MPGYNQLLSLTLAALTPEQLERYQQEAEHWWARGMRQITASLLNRYYRPGTALRILDAGCGTGALLGLLSEYGVVCGVDIEGWVLPLAQGRGGHDVIRASIQNLPFAEASFDLIASFDVIYHMMVTDDVAALREFWRLLRPQGRLLLRVPAYNTLRGHHDIAVETRERYNARILSERLAVAGFRVEGMTYANTILFPAVAIKRLGEQIRGIDKARTDLKAAPPIIDALGLGALATEARLIRYVNLPFGLSLFCVALRL